MPTPTKDYAFLCEFLTQSTNGLYSYMHVFDRTATKGGAPIALNGFLVVRCKNLGEKAGTEIYLTDAKNVLVEKGVVFKQEVKGDNVQIVARIRGLNVPDAGEYRFWMRVNSGEPMELCTWIAERK